MKTWKYTVTVDLENERFGSFPPFGFEFSPSRRDAVGFFDSLNEVEEVMQGFQPDTYFKFKVTIMDSNELDMQFEIVSQFSHFDDALATMNAVMKLIPWVTRTPPMLRENK